MLNRVSDLLGYLNMLHRVSFEDGLKELLDFPQTQTLHYDSTFLATQTLPEHMSGPEIYRHDDIEQNATLNYPATIVLKTPTTATGRFSATRQGTRFLTLRCGARLWLHLSPWWHALCCVQCTAHKFRVFEQSFRHISLISSSRDLRHCPLRTRDD